MKFKLVKDIGNAVGYSGRRSHDPKMISNKFTRVLRSEPNFHDVDGACLFMDVSHAERWEMASEH